MSIQIDGGGLYSLACASSGRRRAFPTPGLLFFNHDGQGIWGVCLYHCIWLDRGAVRSHVASKTKRAASFIFKRKKMGGIQIDI